MESEEVIVLGPGTKAYLWFTSRFVLRLAVFAGITGAAAGFCSAAVIPNTAGEVSRAFTKMDFCQADGNLYAFNGLNLYRYDPNGDNFYVVFFGLGSVTSKTWDPADFAFATDSNCVMLPTGSSGGFVWADISSQNAEEKTGLNRNYFSIASRYRDEQVFANGVGDSRNTIYLIDPAGDGSESEVVEVSNEPTGAVAFDAADNLYLADFSPLYDGSGLGEVDIYMVSRGQLDEFAGDSSFVVQPRLIINDVVLAGSDSMVIDANYDIYLGSFVGIAKISPTSDANTFSVTTVEGDIYANPWAEWPPPSPVFCGITADVRSGVLYYGVSEMDQNYIYGPYVLDTASIEAVSRWSADLDGDGVVDVRDLLILVDDYCQAGRYKKGDINLDDKVDLKDFAVLSGQWFDEAPWYGSSP